MGGGTAKYFILIDILIDAMVNGIIFLILCSDSSLQIYRNTIHFYISSQYIFINLITVGLYFWYLELKER